MLVPVIISGGSGSRLWPISRQTHPKPFIELPDGSTLIGKTYERAASIKNVSEIYTVTNENHHFLAEKCYSKTSNKTVKRTYLLEPFGRNTAPAIAAAALHISVQFGGGTKLLILPADHIIEDVEKLNAKIEMAAKIADEGQIVTFGIKPTHAETGYGYIKVENDKFQGFYEKPLAHIAQEYFHSGEYFWNSGMFCFTAETIIAGMKAHCPEILSAVSDCLVASATSKESNNETIMLESEIFGRIEGDSIDFAVLEKASNISCIQLDNKWSDIGSWTSYASLLETPRPGDIVEVKSKNCIVESGGKTIGLVGVEDLIVVNTNDAILVADKNSDQDVKEVFDQLKKSNNETALTPQVVWRSWGSFTVISADKHTRIRQMNIDPGQSVSLQSNENHSEHWIIVSGSATVVNGDEELTLARNDSTLILAGNSRSLANEGADLLIVMEVQTDIPRG